MIKTSNLTTQIIGRALLWIWIFSIEVVQIDLLKQLPQNYLYYVVTTLVAIGMFSTTLTFSNSLLIRDLRELYVYDLLVQIVGLLLHFFYYWLTPFFVLCYVVLMLKFVRLLWPGRTVDGKALSGWPTFGLIGLYCRIKGLDSGSGASKGHDRIVYLVIIAILVSTVLVYLVGLQMPPLSFWALVAAAMITLYYKRFNRFLAFRESLHFSMIRKLASAKANAAAKSALADSAAALAAVNAELKLLNAQREQMLADIQVKNAALRDAAHDLMQPIMKIQAQIVEAVGTQDERVRSELGAALQIRVSEYARSISDTIYAAKITTQVQEPRLLPLPLARLRSDTADELLDLAEAHGCELVVRASVRFPDYHVLADEDIFARILANLVGNAICHSGSKWVLVTLRKRGSQCMVAVWDQGRGIDGAASDDHAANFVAFSERIKIRTRSGYGGGGHGIGVNNVKQLCAGLGSQMRLYSRPGSGSVFYFMLPLAS